MHIATPEAYEVELRSCTRCSLLLAQKPVDPANGAETVEPRPIVRTPVPRRIMLIGQAPGLTEYRTSQAFSGQAGQHIRALFAECGLGPAEFEQHVFTSAVAKCFPGSKLTKRRRGEGFRREDLKPSAVMLDNCRPFLLAQLELVSPQLVVLLGGMALEAFLELRAGKHGKTSLEQYVGSVHDWNGRRVVPLAHTSGGSFWLNNPSNKALQERAKLLLAQEIAAVSQ